MVKVSRFLAVVAAGISLSGAEAGAPDARFQARWSGHVVQSEFVFENAPFASAHASTIVETPDGLVAAWFGGTREGAPDVGIWSSRKVDGAWTPPIEVATGVQPDGTRHPCWNPVLFELSNRELALFYKAGPSPQRWWGMVKTSRDRGRTWSDARRLPDGVLGPIKNKPVKLADGGIIAPSSTETPERPSTWRVHFERSVDGGVTWTPTKPLLVADGSRIDAIQPSVLIHRDGRLQALGRTRSGRIFETWSTDRGQTWSSLTLTMLPNPSAGIDAVTLRDGRHLVVYNHTAQGRSPLNVSLSRDGKTWEAALVLESEPGEYSYPAVIQTSDGLVHITYTWKRQRIKHVAIDPARLKPVPMRDAMWPAETETTTTDVLIRVDHLVYATPDLNLGIERLEKLLGVRATPGGQHPGRGTRNALISVGPRTYIEIIGPDPEQPKPAEPRPFGIDGLTAPRLVTWAANESDLPRLVQNAASHGVRLGEIGSGSRRRPDGFLLTWQYTNPRFVVADGLVPFFIDWGTSPHPAQSAVQGGRLVALSAEHPDPERVKTVLTHVGLDLQVTKGPRAQLIATINSARGRTELR